MSLEQVLVVVVILGLAVGGFALLRWRSETRPSRPDYRSSPATELDPNSPEGAVQRLTDTIGALRRLSELRDLEIAKHEAPGEAGGSLAPPEAVEDEGWRPVAPGSLPRTPRPFASGLVRPHTKRAPSSPSERRVAAGRAFSPAAPISNRDLFAGRGHQMETLVDVVFEIGQHAVIYGERGVGKTSLATIMALVFRGDEKKLPIRVNCDSRDDFTSIWRKVFDEIEIALGITEESSALPAPVQRTLEEIAVKQKITANDVRKALMVVAPVRECVIFIDEFDTVVDNEAPRQFADTIKMLSDQLVPATSVLIGIADNIEQLLAEHASIQRALVLVHMPRMSTAELKEIVSRGLDLLGMTIEPDALDRVAHLSQGFPHYTHLIAQAASRAAIQQGAKEVTLDHVNGALNRVVERIHSSIRDAYSQATSSARDSLYQEVLMASALAESDARGFFSPAAVRKPLTAIMGKTYDIPTFARHLNSLAGPARGAVLEKVGTARRFRYRFADPLLQPYVIMQGVALGRIPGELLERFSEHAVASTRT